MMKKNLILCVFSLILLFSCSYKKIQPITQCPPMPRGTIEVVSHTELSVQDVQLNLQWYPDYAGYFDYHDLYDQVNARLGNNVALQPIAHEVIRYRSTDNNGLPVELTGLLIYPWSAFKTLKAPIVSVNHGTQLQKKYAPSKWKSASWSDWKYFPEMLIADIMAMCYGWVIIMPDYQGMGDDTTENHPYCVREKLATATADLMQHTQEYLNCNYNAYVTWNGQAFLYGYSEGGFVTMAAAQELENRGVHLDGVVCMDGPYDLTGTMLNVMLSDQPFPVPYFLPMLMVGYNTIYPSVYDYPVMLKEPYRTDIPKYTTGFYDESVVNGIMPSDRILKKVFTDAFMDSLKNTGSMANHILYSNNTYVNWIPKSRMLLWHCKNDDCVPFGNFVAAKDKFTGLGLTNIDYVEWPPVDPDPSKGTIHVAVAPRAFYEGSLWIYNQTK